MAPRQLPYIDALRGLAVMGVVAVHAAITLRPQHPILAWMAAEGARGVQLFYVASALTLGLSWQQRRTGEAAPTRNFLLRRLFRIAPMFYAAIVFYLFTAGTGPQYWAPNGIEPWFVVVTALFLHGWHPETVASVVPGGWSVAVEMTFYLLLPAILPMLRGRRQVVALLMASLAVYAANRWAVPRLFTYPPDQTYLIDSFAYLDFFGQAPVFAIGLLLWVEMRQGLAPVRALRIGLPALALLGLSLVMGVRGVPEHLLAAIFFAVLAWMLSVFPVRLLVNPVTVWLGRISFSVYLVHIGVIRALRELGAAHWFPAGDLGALAHYVAVLSLSAAVAALTYRWIERPGIFLGARLIRRLEFSRSEAKSSGASTR